MLDQEPANQHVDTFFNKGVIGRMAKKIDSGEVAQQFGEKFSRKGLTSFADAMASDVKTLTPGTDFVNQARQDAIKTKEERLFLTSLHNSKISGGGADWLKTKPETVLRMRKKNDLGSDIFEMHLQNYFHSILVDFFSNDNPHSKLSNKNVLTIKLGFEEGVPEEKNMFLWQKEKDSTEIVATVRITDPVVPFTQEEYFHAAQEMALGSVEGLPVLDNRVSEASKHLTHSSILIDRILSSAAVEAGPKEFIYWSQIADKVTNDFNKKHLGQKNSPWEKTLLGKSVNKRFQYPVVDYEELGNFIQNFTQDVESFVFKPDGSTIAGNEALLELLSLQFGTTQYDLMHAMLDLVQTQGKTHADSVEIGKQMVSWGKKLLIYYKGKPEEREIVTHHVEQVQPINKNHYQYESTHSLIDQMNDEIKKGKIPQPLLSLQGLADISWKNALKAATELTKNCFLSRESDEVITPSKEILGKYQIDLITFNKIMRKAKKLYSIYKVNKEEREKHKRSSTPLKPILMSRAKNFKDESFY